jgi:hypothetical protein
LFYQIARSTIGERGFLVLKTGKFGRRHGCPPPLSVIAAGEPGRAANAQWHSARAGLIAAGGYYVSACQTLRQAPGRNQAVLFWAGAPMPVVASFELYRVLLVFLVGGDLILDILPRQWRFWG